MCLALPSTAPNDTQDAMTASTGNMKTAVSSKNKNWRNRDKDMGQTGIEKIPM
jgi:hypothetical protein